MPQPESDQPDVRRSLRALPAIATLLDDPTVCAAAGGIERAYLVAMAQVVVGRARADALSGTRAVNPDSVRAALVDELHRLSQPRLTRVINATGVIIHTNLGRAPVSHAAERAMAEAASSYLPLELELETGRRGGRMSEITRLLRLLTGAEAALVVNNNAAAVLLVLSALCAGREVVLSRSQAVEIGGGFRIPDVLAQSGARLVEVGTTNRTYARDFERAIGDETAALLTVHWSNFKIIGFTAQPTVAELAEVAHRRGIRLIEDLGSGSLLDTSLYGLAHEPTVAESLSAGADVVCFSGDKLFGGPQAGVIAGRQAVVEQIAAHPLARAMRADKTALAGVAETLRHYLRGEAAGQIPVWRMISASLDELERRCRSWAEQLAGICPVVVTETLATVGGGSLPGETLSSRALALDATHVERHGVSLDQLAAILRHRQPAVIARIDGARLLVDARTVLPDQDADLVEALAAALQPGS